MRARTPLGAAQRMGLNLGTAVDTAIGSSLLSLRLISRQCLYAAKSRVPSLRSAGLDSAPRIGRTDFRATCCASAHGMFIIEKATSH